MPHQNSVFHDLQKHVPWSVFDRLVEEHAADFKVRRLTTKDQFIALLYGQLSGATSLREAVLGLQSHAARLYHLGVRPVCRSTLSDANGERPSAVFSGLFAEMVKQAGRGLRRKMGDSLYLIDATSLRLSSKSTEWARFSTGVYGAKAHVIYDADADCPIYAAVTAANVNDITAAQAMPIEPNATVVCDLGYYDFAWWAKLDAAGCRIVTRFKANTKLTVVSERYLPLGSDILSDRTGFLPARQAKNRKNPFTKPVREVRIRIETGKVLRILSNDLTARGEEIAALYKRRWAIELFFRWVKQVLKITKFFGTTENAVRIQIAVALIAFLLLRLAHAAQKSRLSPLEFARLVRANLMHRRHINRLLRDNPTPARQTSQMVLQWT
jgi:hypothetical protein